MSIRSRALRIAALLLCLAVATAAGARDFKVDPGEVPQLRPGEGLLVVAVDSDRAVRSLRIRSVDSLFAGERLDGIGQGSTMGLYVLPAGTYRWDRLNIGWLTWDMSDDPEGRFEVEAGQINYAGDLVYRDLVSLHIANRGLRAMDWLDREHPQLAKTFDFAYAGHYPDPFPAFYRAQLHGRTGAAVDRHLPAPPPGELPLPVRELWREPRLDSMAMSRDGRYAASAVHEGDLDWALDVFDLDADTVSRVATSAGTISDIEWIADDMLSAYVQTLDGMRLMLFRFGADGRAVPYTMRREGFMVDSLPGDEDAIVFASASRSGEILLHRLDVRDTAALDRYGFAARERLNAGLERDQRWFIDGRGQVRAAVIEREEKDEDGEKVDVPYLVYRGGDGFSTVMKLDDADAFRPVAMSADGRMIYGLSEQDRAQRELVEFDPVQKKITRTLFSRPGIDVARALIDEQRRPIGAAFYEDGQLVSEYFDDDRQAVAASLARAFPGRTVAVLDRDRDNRRQLLWIDGSDQPPQVYLLDREKRNAQLLDEAAPWLAGKEFAPSHALRVRAGDGQELEAYLTLPPGEGKRPLVVIPHGGPIGVADRRHFAPEVQFLASLGYAVLQVNFRGSEGYGVRFRESGYRGEGTLIEDDIDAAIVAALAQFPLDPQRMCVVGASYGGQSGLSLAVRSPQRFRCVVSISGVSDRILFFTASDSGRSEEGREQLEKIIGDPNTQLEQMVATSPLFRYDVLATPVMLVHGGEDIRVDYEHTRRMLRMLNLAGRPPVLLEFDDEAHGIVELDNVETTWNGIAGFLRQHLDGIAPPAAGDATAKGRAASK